MVIGGVFIRESAYTDPIYWRYMRLLRIITGTAALVAASALVWPWVSVDVRTPAPTLPVARLHRTGNLVIEPRSIGGRSYTVFRPRTARVAFTLTRPSRDDAAVLLAVAGTYTSPRDTVEGFVVLDGRIVQANERQGWDGAVIIDHGRTKIVQTDNGRLLTRAYLRAIAARGASLFQTHLLVSRGAPVAFKPQPFLPRRALVTFTDGSPAIIESIDAVDLTTFAADLAALGVRDAANLDMGTWSEGWYRNPATGAITVMGIPNSATARQTNWITFAQQ